MAKQPFRPLMLFMVSNMLRLPPNVSYQSNPNSNKSDITLSTKIEVKLCLMTTVIITVSHFKRRKGHIIYNKWYSKVELFNIVVFLPSK